MTLSQPHHWMIYLSWCISELQSLCVEAWKSLIYKRKPFLSPGAQAAAGPSSRPWREFWVVKVDPPGRCAPCQLHGPRRGFHMVFLGNVTTFSPRSQWSLLQQFGGKSRGLHKPLAAAQSRIGCLCCPKAGLDFVAGRLGTSLPWTKGEVNMKRRLYISIYIHIYSIYIYILCIHT